MSAPPSKAPDSSPRRTGSLPNYTVPDPSPPTDAKGGRIQSPVSTLGQKAQVGWAILARQGESLCGPSPKK
jgi:hypothetical protein